MTESPVVIVASAGDTVARRLARAVERRGREALVLDGPAAARLFTIRLSGRAYEVTPELPLFIRHSAWWHGSPRGTADERFAFNESYSAIWSVAVLSNGPVINRPDGGWPADLTAGTIAPLLGPCAGTAVTETCASGPAHVSSRRRPPDDAGQSGPHDDGHDETGSSGTPARRELMAWGKTADLRTGPVRSLPEGIPLRARLVDPDAAYEIITVIGDRAFAATTDPRTAELALAELSVRIVRQARVHFATVTWEIGADGAVPVLLTANPQGSDLRYAWEEVEDALCADLIP